MGDLWHGSRKTERLKNLDFTWGRSKIPRMQDQRYDRMARDLHKRENTPDRFQFNPVAYHATQCPNCGSAHSRVYRSEKMSPQTICRIHKCKQCKIKFKSLQTLPFVDRHDPAKDPPDTL